MCSSHLSGKLFSKIANFWPTKWVMQSLFTSPSPVGSTFLLCPKSSCFGDTSTCPQHTHTHSRSSQIQPSMNTETDRKRKGARLTPFSGLPLPPCFALSKLATFQGPLPAATIFREITFCAFKRPHRAEGVTELPRVSSSRALVPFMTSPPS